MNKHARSRRGQVITEYAAIIAFVAVLVSMVFAIGGGRLSSAVQDSFSAITNQLFLLAAAH